MMTQVQLDQTLTTCPSGHAVQTSARYCDQCGLSVVPADGTGRRLRPARRVARGSTRVWLIGALIAGALVAGVVGIITHDSGPKRAANGAIAPVADEALPLQAAYDACSAGKGGSSLEIADAGRSLIIDTVNEYGSVSGVVSVFAELGTSQALVASVSSTTAMMGMQTESDGDFEYRWSYHPDNGLNMVIRDPS